MLIRPAADHDVLFLKRLLEQLGYADAPDRDVAGRIEQHRKPGYELLVAESDREVVGFIALHVFEVFHFAGRLGRISAFCVEERLRGRGIGIALLGEAESFFKKQGCTKIEVTSNQRRTDTHRFYLRRGYVEDSRRFVKYADAF